MEKEMNLNDLRDQIHENAKAKGFYDVEKMFSDENYSTEIKHAFFAQKIALITSELSEALEADREDKRANVTSMDNAIRELIEESSYGKTEFATLFQKYVKNSVEDELADSIIRIFDLCGWLNIDIQWHIEMKMRYNSLREYKHGKQY